MRPPYPIPGPIQAAGYAPRDALNVSIVIRVLIIVFLLESVLHFGNSFSMPLPKASPTRK